MTALQKIHDAAERVLELTHTSHSIADRDEAYKSLETATAGAKTELKKKPAARKPAAKPAVKPAVKPAPKKKA